MPILMILKNYKVVIVTGKDSKRYLQSKLTIDMKKFKNYKYNIAAHCSVQGKVIGLLMLFRYNEGYAYIIKKNTVDFQIKELKKYSIFSKVSINIEKDFEIIGLVGVTSNFFLKKFFFNIPNEEKKMVIEDNIILFLLDNLKKRYLLIFPKEKKHLLYKMLLTEVIIKNFKYWNFLDIESGFPIVEKNIQEKFLPQELGLQNIQGIDFHKGCYQGQEVISRAYFKKIKNNFLCWMISYKKNILKINFKIEAKIKEKWVIIGKIIYVVASNNNFLWIQAILSKKINKNYKFRVFSKNNEKLILKKIFYI
ncbi:tRNA-modifying protein YgfZ [Buchnera aphidicola]|uniref:tRNA-modifying protein YgfZ n=1 Tax=Buchnera aphidicola TaxID=9 RepID=UPI0031B6F6B8